MADASQGIDRGQNPAVSPARFQPQRAWYAQLNGRGGADIRNKDGVVAYSYDKAKMGVSLPGGQTINVFSSEQLPGGTAAHFSPEGQGIAIGGAMGRLMTDATLETKPGWKSNEELAKYTVSHELTHLRWDRLQPEQKKYVMNEIFIKRHLRATRDFAVALISGGTTKPHEDGTVISDYYRDQYVRDRDVDHMQAVPDDIFPVPFLFADSDRVVRNHWYPKELIINELLGFAAVPDVTVENGQEQQSAQRKAATVEHTLHEYNNKPERKPEEKINNFPTLHAMRQAITCLAEIESNDREQYGVLKQWRLVGYENFNGDYQVIKQNVAAMVENSPHG